MGKTLQHDQITQFTRLQTASSDNIYDSTFRNSPCRTNIVNGTNNGGQIISEIKNEEMKYVCTTESANDS